MCLAVESLLMVDCPRMDLTLVQYPRYHLEARLPSLQRPERGLYGIIMGRFVGSHTELASG